MTLFYEDDAELEKQEVEEFKREYNINRTEEDEDESEEEDDSEDEDDEEDGKYTDTESL